MVASGQALGEDDLVLTALDSQLEVFFAPDAAPATRDLCGYWAAAQLLEVATAWAADALGLPGKAGTYDRTKMASASQLYHAVLEGFRSPQLTAWGICTKLRDVAHTRAELLYALRSWAACGPAYDLAIRFDPSDERLTHAANNAMVCRHNALQQLRASLGQMPTKQRIEVNLQYTEDWRQLLRAYHRFMCVSDSHERARETYGLVGFARAQTFYEGGALWEAAIVFRTVAQQSASSTSGARAAQRYAEIMEDLAKDDICRRELTLDIERLQATYCSAIPASDEACASMTEVVDRVGFNVRPQL